MISLLIEHLDALWTMDGVAPRKGVRQGDVAPIPDGAVACDGQTIVAIGPTADVRARIAIDADTHVIDGRGRSLVPGFVDGHTHVVFAGDRREELRRRLGGATYAEIAAAGGGILSTVQATRAASEIDLARQTRVRLAEILAAGTTTCEAKSGYGLETESELRMLRAIAALNESQPVELASTFMGAHEVPPEYRGRQTEYVRLVIDEMIPAVAGHAEWCDVFCDRGFFTPEESIEILQAGRRAGMKPRLHADELAASGGPAVAARVGARSADHLVRVTPEGIQELANAGTVATLLPCAAFYLKLGAYAPARALISAGVPVALASDVNPGGGFSPSLAFAMTLACFGMGLTFEEALTAVTINGAYSLDRHERIGSLEPGKQFDAVLIDGPAVNLLRINASPIVSVFKKERSSMLVTNTVQELLDAFSAPTPTPGGGSAAALAGAVAASLLAMVAGMPKTRTGAADERVALETVYPELIALKASLAGLIDRDADAYNQVVAAYRLPKATDEEKAARKAAVALAMRAATDVPLETARAAAAVLRHSVVVNAHGNANAKSDVGVAISLAKTALSGARMNVEVNLEGADAAYAAEVRSELENLSALY